MGQWAPVAAWTCFLKSEDEFNLVSLNSTTSMINQFILCEAMPMANWLKRARKNCILYQSEDSFEDIQK